ncbi:hypothetical protein ACHQM5_004251 [Ranunculus cassubicifolius]
MGRVRAPCCEDHPRLKKGPWKIAEDLKLRAYVQKNGHGNWRALPKKAGLLRCGKSCRLRWINYLNPDIKRGHFTQEEEDAIIKLHKSFGNKWAKITSYLPGRTDNEIKNIWNTYIKRRLEEGESSILRGNNTKKPSNTSLSKSSSSSSLSSCVSNINSKDADTNITRILESSLSTDNSYDSYGRSKIAESGDHEESNYMPNGIGEEDPFEGLLEILDDPDMNFSRMLEDTLDQQYTTTLIPENPGSEGDWVQYLEAELGLEDSSSANDEIIAGVDLDPVAIYFCD